MINRDVQTETAAPSNLAIILEAIRSGAAGSYRIVTRQYIEKTLSGTIAPSKVTHLLRSLRTLIDEGKEPRYGYGRMPTPRGGHDTHIYWYGKPPKEPERAAFTALTQAYHDLLERLDTGNVAEQYVRGLLVRSGRFTGVPRPKRVGYRNAGHQPRSDLRVSLNTASGPIRLSIEVKNLREVVHSTSPVFVDLLRNALNEDGLPVLVTTEVSTEMAELCETLGVVLIQLRRRIFPKRIEGETKTVPSLLKEYVNVTGPVEFECVNPARPFQHPELISEAVMHDLKAVSDIDRFGHLNAVWDQNRALAEQFVEKVKSRGYGPAARNAALAELRQGLSL